MRWNADKNILCSECGLKPALYKRLILCSRCYCKHYQSFPDHSLKMPIKSMMAQYKRALKFEARKRNLETKDIEECSIRGERGQQNKAEILFAQRHPTCLFHAATFDLGDSSYTPDFYDCRGNVFYEVIGTRQRFETLKDKIRRFRELFWNINLEVVCPDGEPYHSIKSPELVSGQQYGKHEEPRIN